MKHDEYQSAFSRMEPGQEAVEAVLFPAEKLRVQKRFRLRTLPAAAVLIALLLSGTVFAATHFHWFSLGGAETVTEPVNTDPEAFGKAENLPPAPQGLLQFDQPSAATYIGFRLPEAYEEGKRSLDCWRLREGLYRRYYRDPDPGSPDSPLLTIQILDTDVNKLLTRYPTEAVKSETLNGLETVWVRIDGSTDGRTQYCLFQKNEALGCVAAITSTVSFADAEQAAGDLQYEDSGIPIPAETGLVRYGYRLAQLPEGWELDYHYSMADKWDVRNAVLADPEQELSEAWTSAYLTRSTETRFSHLSISIRENLNGFDDLAPTRYRTVWKSGSLCGREARWIRSSTDGDVYIQILFPEYGVQLTGCIGVGEFDPETHEWLSCMDSGDEAVALLEQTLAQVEILPVPIAEKAPSDFMPFAVG